MTGSLYYDAAVKRNSPSRDHILVRLSAGHRRLLGCDPPALVWRAERARTWLSGGVTPPTLHVERGCEIEMLTSSLIAQLYRMDVPVIVMFESAAAVKHWVNAPVFGMPEPS
jgi:hypothetical protein